MSYHKNSANKRRLKKVRTRRPIYQLMRIAKNGEVLEKKDIYDESGLMNVSPEYTIIGLDPNRGFEEHQREVARFSEQLDKITC